MTKQLIALFVIILAALPQIVIAQAGNSWLENTMYESGKINVVIGVVVIMFLILLIYLISIDMKLRKLEKDDK
jgi:hypothetical protein